MIRKALELHSENNEEGRTNKQMEKCGMGQQPTISNGRF